MITLEEIRKRLTAMNLKAVAVEAKLSYYKVRQIANGNRRIDYESVKRMSDYLTQGK